MLCPLLRAEVIVQEAIERRGARPRRQEQHRDALEQSLPEDRDDRIRSIRYQDRVANGPVAPTYFELERWREG